MKKWIYRFAHALFWCFAAFFSLRYSFIRPTLGAYAELLCLALIATAVYLNYFLFYPRFFQRNKILYLLLSLLSLIIITAIEGRIAEPTIRKQLLIEEPLIVQYIHSVYFFVFLRDTAFLAFFVILKLYRDARQLLVVQQQKFNIENHFLRSKITPHYFYNVLNSIYSDAIIHDEKLPDYILNLSQLLHYYIDDADKDVVTLNDELNFYKKYIELEQKRYVKPISLSFNVLGDPNAIFIAPLLFEPMINNAFKYVPKDGSGSVKIVFDLTHDHWIHFSIYNNKTGSNVSRPYSTRQGLINLNERLNLLYHNQFNMDIVDEDKNYSITLNLNYKKVLLSGKNPKQ